MKRLALCVAVVVLAGVGRVEGAVVVSSWHLVLVSRDSIGDQAEASEDTVSLPFQVARTALTAGGSSAGAEYDFLTTGAGGASFLFDFDLSRTGVIDSQSNASGDIHFQVTEESTADVDGLFSLDGAGRIRADIKLRDLTISGGSAGFIYSSLQQSLATSDEVFQVGGLAGDDKNSLVGSLPVPLVPGHEYLIDYHFDIITPAYGDAGASAVGNLEVIIAADSGGGGVIPEPSSLIVWSLIILTFAGIGWQRRRKGA